MLLFQVSAPHLSITPGSRSLRSLFSDHFLGTVMLSDVTVIVSQRNTDINLMLAEKKITSDALASAGVHDGTRSSE